MTKLAEIEGTGAHGGPGGSLYPANSANAAGWSASPATPGGRPDPSTTCRKGRKSNLQWTFRRPRCRKSELVHRRGPVRQTQTTS